MTLSQQIADKIQRRINHLGIERQQFAQMMGVGPSTVTQWLSGKQNFTIKTLDNIQQVLKVNFFDLSDEVIEGDKCFPTTYNNFDWIYNGTDIRERRRNRAR